MPINKDDLETLHPEQHDIKHRVKFWRTAVDGEFDECRWRATKEKEKHDKWLLKWEYESHHSFVDRCRLANDFAFSQLIVEAYTGHFSRAKINIEIDGLKDDAMAKIDTNFDGNDNSLKMTIINDFIETLVTGKTTILTDIDTDELPFTYIVHRETIKDWAYEKEQYLFFKWFANIERVDGISRSHIPTIFFITEEEIGRAIKIDDGEFKIVELNPNTLGHVPAYDIWSGNEGIPIINSIAKLQFNLFNLDSEWRSILRNQGGMNILAVPEGSGIDKLTTKTMVTIPPDGAEPKWIAYPASGLDAHKIYFENLTKFINQYSRLRQQISQPESGKAKTMDFLETEAVMGMISDEVEKANVNAIMDWGRLLDTPLEGKVHISIDKKSFRIEELKDKLDNLLKLKALTLPMLWENAAIEKFAKDELGLSQKQIDEGLEQLEEELPVMLEAPEIEKE